jgi:hypothetical protein
MALPQSITYIEHYMKFTYLEIQENQIFHIIIPVRVNVIRNCVYA